MKKFILGLSIFMVITIIIAVFVFENQEPVSLPQLNQPDNVPENAKSINEPEQSQKESLQPVTNDKISYSLQNKKLRITYDKGKNWEKVPIKKDALFEGEYNGSEQELIDGSYILTKDCAVFLYSEGEDWRSQKIVLKYSLDQGKTWHDSVVTEEFPQMRFRKVDFLNDQFGYVIVSGDRTMSQEYLRVFTTHDGGKSWEEAAETGTTRLISDGGFITETTGFLSYGTINPRRPNLYVTNNGGNSWSKADFNIPKKYKNIFVQAGIPEKEGGHLAVLVNQGPNGDYKGGKVKGKFISKDGGKTWDFSMEVQPNETK